MAGSSFLTLLDDIALLTKKAAKQTAGIVGDDVALNAQQVLGSEAAREIPVVMKVAKGSLINKAVLIAGAVPIGIFAPQIIPPMLMVGGAYLCYEGAEKIIHKIVHKEHDHNHDDNTHENDEPKSAEEKAAEEKKKVKGAIRTDFILSAEIIAITLGTVATAPLGTQIGVLGTIGAGLTVGVYGFVAAVVKMDDAGIWLSKQKNKASQLLGKGLINFAPMLTKTLSVLGTAAMFIVGGGIIMHGAPFLENIVHAAEHVAHGIPYMGGTLEAIAPTVCGALTGIVTGVTVVGGMTVLKGPIEGVKTFINKRRSKKNITDDVAKNSSPNNNPSLTLESDNDSSAITSAHNITGSLNTAAHTEIKTSDNSRAAPKPFRPDSLTRK